MEELVEEKVQSILEGLEELDSDPFEEKGDSSSPGVFAFHQGKDSISFNQLSNHTIPINFDENIFANVGASGRNGQNDKGDIISKKNFVSLMNPEEKAHDLNLISQIKEMQVQRGIEKRESQNINQEGLKPFINPQTPNKSNRRDGSNSIKEASGKEPKESQMRESHNQPRAIFKEVFFGIQRKQGSLPEIKQLGIEGEIQNLGFKNERRDFLSQRRRSEHIETNAAFGFVLDCLEELKETTSHQENHKKIMEIVGVLSGLQSSFATKERLEMIENELNMIKTSLGQFGINQGRNPSLFDAPSLKSRRLSQEKGKKLDEEKEKRKSKEMKANQRRKEKNSEFPLDFKEKTSRSPKKQKEKESTDESKEEKNSELKVGSRQNKLKLSELQSEESLEIDNEKLNETHKKEEKSISITKINKMKAVEDKRSSSNDQNDSSFAFLKSQEAILASPDLQIQENQKENNQIRCLMAKRQRETLLKLKDSFPSKSMAGPKTKTEKSEKSQVKNEYFTQAKNQKKISRSNSVQNTFNLGNKLIIL